MIEPPRGVTRYLADQPQTEENAGRPAHRRYPLGDTPAPPRPGSAGTPDHGHTASSSSGSPYPESGVPYAVVPLPARQPSLPEGFPEPRGLEPDVMEQRYAALAAWNESARTITMAAVEAETAYPAGPGTAPVLPADLAGTPLPRHAVPPAVTSHRGRRTRRTRVTLLGVVVLAAGATAVWATGDRTEPPAAAGTTVTGAVTTGDQVAEPPANTGATPSSTPPAAVTTSTSPSASRSAAGRAALRLTLPTGRPAHGLPRTSSRPDNGSPSLSAFYDYQPDSGSGSVQVINPEDSGATGWTVALDLPGAETVTVTGGDVTVSQSGSSVVFRPSGSGAPASGVIDFSFAIDPVPSEAPTGCTIDDHPCS